MDNAGEEHGGGDKACMVCPVCRLSVLPRVPSNACTRISAASRLSWLSVLQASCMQLHCTTTARAANYRHRNEDEERSSVVIVERLLILLFYRDMSVSHLFTSLIIITCLSLLFLIQQKS